MYTLHLSAHPFTLVGSLVFCGSGYFIWLTGWRILGLMGFPTEILKADPLLKCIPFTYSLLPGVFRLERLPFEPDTTLDTLALPGPRPVE